MHIGKSAAKRSLVRCALAGFLVTAVCAATCHAQDQPGARRAMGDPARGAGRNRPMNYGNWVGQKILTKESIEKIGITPEQEEKLRGKIKELKDQETKSNSAIRELAMKQAGIARDVLNESGASETQLMEIIEQIGALRTEQAKSNTRMLVFIRDTLNEEQRRLTREVIAAEGRERAARRMRNLAPQGEGDQQRVRGPRKRPNKEKGGAQAHPDAAERPAVPRGW